LNAALVVQHVNVYSGKHLVGTWNPASGTVYYAYSDWLGTKRYEADGGGNYVNSWASLPFGDNQTALGAGVDATEHHFTGQERDAESGLDHFAARYYQSQTGRWLLPDWSATPVPVPYAAFTNPQSLNLYTYVGNNPVNAVDVDGHVEGGGVSTYTAQQGSALWQCVHTGPAFGADTDGCDFGAWGVDDSGLQPQAEDATQAAQDQTADQKNSDAKAEQAEQQGQAQQQRQNAGPAQSAAQQQNGDIQAARQYLSGSPEMQTVMKAFDSGHFHIKINHDNDDSYNPRTRTVNWDPHSALRTTTGGHQTPAMGLGHEMAHGTGNRHQFAIDKITPDSRYGNKEERRVIRNYENPAARELGESPRYNHNGTTYHVDCPTCQ
jgi:RHS repeat-associated protein